MEVSTTSELTGAQAGGLAAFMGVWFFLYIAIIVIAIVAYWKIFTKAGEEGWKCLIPIYNIIILLKIVGRPWWWLLLLLVPFVNIIIMVIVYERPIQVVRAWAGLHTRPDLPVLHLLSDSRLRQFALCRPRWRSRRSGLPAADRTSAYGTAARSACGAEHLELRL